MSRPWTYVETFDDGPGGWFAWESNSVGPKPLEQRGGCVVSRSPWWIDYNHAPPGAGYLHLLFSTFTKGPGLPEHYLDVGGRNRLIDGGFPSDYTNARVSVRLCGELHAAGAELCLLVQARVGPITSGWILTGQPIRVEKDFTEQTITCVPDESQWTSLGARHDRTDTYGHADLADVLADVNCDIILVLFPLTVRPMGAIDGDPHLLRPGKDYPVWRSSLPEGYVMLDKISIEFAQHH
jgi:hypothetical protein